MLFRSSLRPAGVFPPVAVAHFNQARSVKSPSVRWMDATLVMPLRRITESIRGRQFPRVEIPAGIIAPEHKVSISYGPAGADEDVVSDVIEKSRAAEIHVCRGHVDDDAK